MISRRRFISQTVAASAGLVSTHFPVNLALSCDLPVGQKKRKSSYIRIYHEAESVPDDGALERLADCMTSCSQPPNAASLFPGYTYFGQFIDHDLTLNDVRFDAPKGEQEKAPNYRSPFLDLDSVYGNGPPLDCQFTGPKDQELFVVFPTLESRRLGLKGGSCRDIPFENETRPVIGDRIDLRNVENLILRQLHVVFLKFHNEVIRQLPQHDKDPAVPQNGTLFERARRLVTWIYQWLVWYDFLSQMRVPGSFRDPQRSKGHPKEDFQLPLEFVLAGFRFGHSMVQGKYALNRHHNFDDETAIDLKELINAKKESTERLREEYVIEWSRFFLGLEKKSLGFRARPIQASKIDTHINPALGNLLPGTFDAFSQPSRSLESPNLPFHTLIRGARARLASGQQVVQKLKERDDRVKEIDLKEDEFLQEAGLIKNTPLWYYILKEAEVTPNSETGGDRLGRVGTYLVEDTIEAALQNDSDSFLVQRDKWCPPRWILPPGKRTIAGLIEFAGLG